VTLVTESTDGDHRKDGHSLIPVLGVGMLPSGRSADFFDQNDQKHENHFGILIKFTTFALPNSLDNGKSMSGYGKTSDYGQQSFPLEC
jgi:hypothetical protein